MPCRATQDGRVMVESSNKPWSTTEWSGKPLQYSYLEKPMNSMKRNKDRTLRDEPPRLAGVQYATEEEQRNSFQRTGEAKLKHKKRPIVDVSVSESKV